MGRNRPRSNPASGRPSRLDWLAVAGLIGAGAVSLAGLDAPLGGALALVAALGFGTLLAVSEAGMLAGRDPETDGE
jgi:drug/metabolite transporter (DMT)-like permease